MKPSYVVTPIRALRKYQKQEINRSPQAAQQKIPNIMHANLHMNAFSRKNGRTIVGASAYRSGSAVVAAAAYRAGEKLEDKRYEKTHDYTKKQHVLHAEIITPKHAPAWMKNREKLWNAVETGEKRKDAQLAKEAVIVLPRNLNHEQHKQVIEGWIKENLTKRNLIADYAIHNPDATDGGKNPHAHVMFTLRPVEQDGSFGKKLTGYKNGGLDGKEFLNELRFSYQNHLNQTSARNDNKQIVFDLRSYEEKGIDKIPQPKRGQGATHLEERGVNTRRGDKVRTTQHINQAKSARKRYMTVYSKTGNPNKPQTQSNIFKSVHNDITNRYYDTMYGDGTEGSYERNNDWYRR